MALNSFFCADVPLRNYTFTLQVLQRFTLVDLLLVQIFTFVDLLLLLFTLLHLLLLFTCNTYTYHDGLL